MGRRKERRHAALSGVGRRVKLDLFAEPSGDTAVSSTQEVGGDGNFKVVDELLHSPSSSGKRSQNPLLLLGQYSDEELDAGSTDRNYQALPEDASVADDNQEKIATGKEAEDACNNAGNEPPMQNKEHLLMDSDYFQGPLQKLENGPSTKASEDLLGEINSMDESPCLTASDKQPTEDLSSGWKMVLHEESNQYYYWNIKTGETSWEVPEVLALGNSMSYGTVAGVVIEENTSLIVEKGEIMSRKVEGGSMINCETIEAVDHGISMGNGPDEQAKGDSLGDEDVNRDADQSVGTSFHNHVAMVNGNRIDLEHSVESENCTDLPLQLVKHCEIILERLNSLKSLNSHMEGQDFILRCILEIEVRQADIKALGTRGSSLLPFWLHCEAQMKQMEAAIDNFIKCDSSSSIVGTDALCKLLERTDDDTSIDLSEKQPSLAAAESYSPECTDEKLKHGAQCHGASNTFPVDVGVINEAKGTEVEINLTRKPDLHSPDEVDMDVDMEVEDTSHSTTSIQYPFSSGFSNCADVLTIQDSLVPGKILVGPLPVGEWVPPPPPPEEPFPPLPPDGEPFLPPPPDEPAETPSYPPVSHSESVQPFPYTEHYTLPYPAIFEYYGLMPTEVPGTSLYMHPDMQVAISHQPHYYEGGYAVSPVESSGYYSLQSGMLNAISIAGRSAAETSRTLVQTCPNTQESDASGSLLAHAGIMKPPRVHVQPPVETSVNSSENNNVSGSSSSNTIVHVATAAATTSKIQPKASRGKKRTAAVISTLRPNKKVSSMVDKWKAVKEELHEEEEEPENAYEILEKKKQREIEEWRVHHIASGEANDNANFQPLGGDWRERVKRRTAQKKETRQNAQDLATADGNQQPDLNEISRGLPSGWQAYWDDSSKQVYYADMLTSETTWSRPTD